MFSPAAQRADTHHAALHELEATPPQLGYTPTMRLLACLLVLSAAACKHDAAVDAPPLKSTTVEPSQSEPSAAAASPASPLASPAKPWMRGVAVDGELHLVVAADWVDNPGTRSMFAGISGCRAAWALDDHGAPSSTMSYGLLPVGDRADEFVRRGGELTSAPPAAAAVRDGWLWVDLPHQPAMSALSPRWQLGPLAWIGGLERAFGVPPNSVTVQLENIGGEPLERAVIVWTRLGDAEATKKWLAAEGFTNDEPDHYLRSVDGWRHTVDFDEATLKVRVHPPKPFRLTPACGPTEPAPMHNGGVSMGTVEVNGGTVANASAVVARSRGRFLACYSRGLEDTPTLEGALVLVAKIGPNGNVEKVGGGGGVLSPIVGCLKGVVSNITFSPPSGGLATVSIPLTFMLQK